MAAGAGHCTAPTSRGQATAESNKQRPPKRPALVGGWVAVVAPGAEQLRAARPGTWEAMLLEKGSGFPAARGPTAPTDQTTGRAGPAQTTPFPVCTLPPNPRSRSQGPGSSPGPELRVRLCPLPHPRVLCIPTAGPHSDLRPSLSYVSGPIRSGLGLAGRLYKPDRHLLPARAVDGALQTNRGRKR